MLYYFDIVYYKESVKIIFLKEKYNKLKEKNYKNKEIQKNLDDFLNNIIQGVIISPDNKPKKYDETDVKILNNGDNINFENFCSELTKYVSKRCLDIVEISGNINVFLN